jgi:hypothetical protein
MRAFLAAVRIHRDAAPNRCVIEALQPDAVDFGMRPNRDFVSSHGSLRCGLARGDSCGTIVNRAVGV